MPEPDPQFISLLEPVLDRIGLSPTNDQILRLSQHYTILTQWNQRVNLTSIREPRAIVERHFGESLFLAVHLPKAKTVVDVGSGAGFPGLPLAVARPELTVTLVESIEKKAVFLKEASRELENVRVEQGRAENLAARYDWAVCRAVSVAEVLPVLAGLADSIALMASQSIAARLGKGWGSPIPLPWSDERVLVMKHPGTPSST